MSSGVPGKSNGTRRQGDQIEAADVSILIVGYNSASYLRVCLGAVAAGAGACTYQVLFVNNGTDASEDLVHTVAPEVIVRPSLGNIGFAAANNYLAQLATGRYLLLLNPDTCVSPRAIERLIRTADETGVDAAGGMVVSDDGKPAMRTLQRLPTLPQLLLGLIGQRSRGTALPDLSARTVPAEALSGGFLLIRHTRWKELGGLDSSFFLYAEELDLCKRLQDAGSNLALVPSATLKHDTGSGDFFSAQRVLYQVTGNVHYFRKHYSTLYATACTFVMWATCAMRFVVPGILQFVRPRYAGMSNGHRLAALHPWRWIRGYDSPGADPRRR